MSCSPICPPPAAGAGLGRSQHPSQLLLLGAGRTPGCPPGRRTAPPDPPAWRGEPPTDADRSVETGRSSLGVDGPAEIENRRPPAGGASAAALQTSRGSARPQAVAITAPSAQPSASSVAWARRNPAATRASGGPPLGLHKRRFRRIQSQDEASRPHLLRQQQRQIAGAAARSSSFCPGTG